MMILMAGRFRTTGAVVSGVLLLAACNSEEPVETPATTTPPTFEVPTSTPDPTEEAEAAAIEAVERYWEVTEQAGISGDWSEESLAEGARGGALEFLLTFGEIADVDDAVYEGEIVVSDPRVDSLVLEPEPEAQVTACVDDTGWSIVGDPDNYVGVRGLRAAVVRPAEDGEWYVTELVDLPGEGPLPCE